MTETVFLDFLASPIGITSILIYTVWVAVWKGLALWRAGRNNDPFWFIILLIFNTLGILEIVYYFYVSKKPNNK